MKTYTIVVTTNEDRRLHYQTDNELLILTIHRSNSQGLDVQAIHSLTFDETLVLEAYLDDHKSCEIIHNLTRHTTHLP